MRAFLSSRFPLVLVGCAVLAALLCGGVNRGATIQVPADYPTIQAAAFTAATAQPLLPTIPSATTSPVRGVRATAAGSITTPVHPASAVISSAATTLSSVPAPIAPIQPCFSTTIPSAGTRRGLTGAA